MNHIATLKVQESNLHRSSKGCKAAGVFPAIIQSGRWHDRHIQLFMFAVRGVYISSHAVQCIPGC